MPDLNLEEVKQTLEDLRALKDIVKQVPEFRQHAEQAIAGLEQKLKGLEDEVRVLSVTDRRVAERALKGYIGEQVRQKALTPDAAAAQVLIPTEQLDTLVGLIAQRSVIRELVSPIPLSNSRAVVPTRGSVSVEFPGWSGSAAGGDITAGSVTINAEPVVGYTELHRQTVLDAADAGIVQLGQYVLELFLDAYAEAEDSQAFGGTGAPFTGIMNTAGVNAVVMGSGKTSFADVTYDDLVDVIAAIPSKLARSGAGRLTWFFSQSVYGLLLKVKDSTGRPLIDAGTGMLLGYPYRIVPGMPGVADDGAGRGFILFGSIPLGLVLGDRRMYSFEYLRDVNAKGMIDAMRFYNAVAIQVVLPSAFVVLKTATT